MTDPQTGFARYAALVLERLGYGDALRVLYSLGHCQGDGVAFAGPVPPDALLRRVLLGTGHVEAHRTLSAFAAAGALSIEITQRDPHYTHAYTMDVEVVTEDSRLDVPIAEERVDTAVQCFRERLLDDLREQSRRLERRGYAFFDAAASEDRCVRTWTTRHFIIELHELACEDPDDVLAGLDDEGLVGTVEEFANHGAKICGLEARVLARATERELGSACTSALTPDADDVWYYGTARELVADAIDVARRRLAKDPPARAVRRAA